MHGRRLLSGFVRANAHTYELFSVVMMALGANVLALLIDSERVWVVAGIGAGFLLGGTALFFITNRVRGFYDSAHRFRMDCRDLLPGETALALQHETDAQIARRFARDSGVWPLVRDNGLLAASAAFLGVSILLSVTMGASRPSERPETSSSDAAECLASIRIEILQVGRELRELKERIESVGFPTSGAGSEDGCR